jgi:hypothetical protein
MYTSADYAVYNLLGGDKFFKNIELIIPPDEKLIQGSFFLLRLLARSLNLIIR